MLKIIPSPLRKYARFQGRMPRSRFLRWLGLLFLCYLLAGWIDLQFIAPALGYLPNEDVKEQYVVIIAALLLVTPWLSSHVRRLHDVNRSGWWMVFAIPMLLILYFGSDIVSAIYLFLAENYPTSLQPQGTGFMFVTWVPFVPTGLAVLSFSPVILWSLKKGSKEPNRFGARE